jgi:hypothetical protein
MFGIIDENKKFILLDSDHDKLRATALMLAKEETVVVEDFDENDHIIGCHAEKTMVPMFDEDTVDEAIKEYDESEIEKSYDGSDYLKGYAPLPSNEYQSSQREKAYEAETDPIQTHIDRLKDKEQTPEIIAEIEALRIERDEKIAAIKERYPYAE